MVPEPMTSTRRRRVPDGAPGGVDAVTAPQCAAAGADVLVAGSASFKGGPERYAANIAALKGAQEILGISQLLV